MSSRQGGISDDMHEELLATFKMLDQHDEGSIDFNKMMQAMKVHGFEASSETMSQMKKSDSIGVAEYMQYMTSFLSETSNWCKLELQEAFEVFDKEKTSLITVPQIKRVVNRIGEKLTDAEIEQQYFQFDMNSEMVLDITGFSRAAIANESKTF